MWALGVDFMGASEGSLSLSDALCVGNLTTISSDNGLASGRRQAIICTNAGILLNGLMGTDLSEIFIEIHIFLFKKMHLKMSATWRPFSPASVF